MGIAHLEFYLGNLGNRPTVQHCLLPKLPKLLKLPKTLSREFRGTLLSFLLLSLCPGVLQCDKHYSHRDDDKECHLLVYAT